MDSWLRTLKLAKNLRGGKTIKRHFEDVAFYKRLYGEDNVELNYKAKIDEKMEVVREVEKTIITISKLIKDDSKEFFQILSTSVKDAVAALSKVNSNELIDAYVNEMISIYIIRDKLLEGEKDGK